MNPYFNDAGITLYVGDCLDVLPGLPGESVDAVVTDPPYGLGFMGKDWDHGVPGVHFWQEILGVAKPGAHLLAFGGTRTHHRLVCAIEDAGWEIRDTILWVFGQGFPKSLDVSKAIDKERRDNPDWRTVGTWLRARRSQSGFSAKALCAAIGAHGDVNHGGAVSNWENGFSCPTWEQWLAMKQAVGFGDEMDAEVWRLNGRKGTPGEAWTERGVLRERTMTQGGGSSLQIRMGERREVEANITAPATEAAKQWDGWGTALKPAVEPIVLARKPLVGTVAANVQRYGTGALNIDASRVETNGETWDGNQSNAHENYSGKVYGAFEKQYAKPSHPVGRWPANLIHDGSPEVVECFPETGPSPDGLITQGGRAGGGFDVGSGDGTRRTKFQCHGDSGSASRFFYCAKASRADRYSEAGNDHPTVKPLALIQYLIRLIAPPGGVVLDPFLGSGTTAKAAHELGFRCIGIDLEERHCEIAAKRLTQTVLDFGGAA